MVNVTFSPTDAAAQARFIADIVKRTKIHPKVKCTTVWLDDDTYALAFIMPAWLPLFVRRWMLCPVKWVLTNYKGASNGQ